MRLAVVAVLSCALAGVIFAQSPPKAAPAPVSEAQAIARERSLFAADQRHDLAAVGALVANDFVDIGQDGSVETKTGLLKEIPTLKLLRYAESNFRLERLGPYAYALSYNSDATAIGADGKTRRTQNPLNSVWVFRAGRWQVLLHCRGSAAP